MACKPDPFRSLYWENGSSLCDIWFFLTSKQTKESPFFVIGVYFYLSINFVYFYICSFQTTSNYKFSDSKFPQDTTKLLKQIQDNVILKLSLSKRSLISTLIDENKCYKINYNIRNKCRIILKYLKNK